MTTDTQRKSQRFEIDYAMGALCHLMAEDLPHLYQDDQGNPDAVAIAKGAGKTLAEFQVNLEYSHDELVDMITRCIAVYEQANAAMSKEQ